MSKIITIAVDAMGGDNSPHKVINGIILHHRNSKNSFYKIFGDAEIIEKIINSISPKTRYVLSPNNLRDHILPGLLPDRWLDKAMSKVLGLKKN